MTPPASRSDHACLAAADRYVTFLVDHQIYAVPALSVREVIRWVPVTRVPNTTAAVKGVINLRGEIVTVLDLRTRLGLAAADPTDRTCIVVVRTEQEGRRLQAGLIVDTALDVTRIQTTDFEQRSEATPAADCVAGIARTRTGLTILLSVEPLLAGGLCPASTAA